MTTSPLLRILRSVMPLRLLIIGTYRDTDLTRTHPLTAVLADLRHEAGVERLAVHGLDEAAVLNLVTATAGHRLTEPGIALARALQRETEGSPFFIGEILRHLSESGAVFQENNHWTYRGDIAGLGIPEGVKEVIGRRLNRLSETTNKVLGLAAVLGRQFDVGLLARFAETSEEAVLDEAARAALVTEMPGEADRFSFNHALIRTTLYEELGAARRARLHRRVGEALEALTQHTPGARIDELAHHWLAATQVADQAKAVGYARQAGNNALANLAFEEAATLYERALAIQMPHDHPSEELRCDLLLALADAQRGAGNTGYRETVSKAVAAARTLGDGERLAQAALSSARPGGFMASANVVDERLIELYEDANTALGDADSLLRARVLGQLAVELVYTPEGERRHRLSQEAVAIARRLGDAVGLGQVLILRLIAINDPFTLAERLDLTAELAAQVGSSELAWHAAFHRFGALLESGDIGGAERTLAAVEGRAGELRQPFYSWFARTGRTMLAILRGEPSAEAQVFETLEFGTAGGQLDAPAGFGAQIFFLRHNQGRMTELAEVVRANVDAMPHAPSWRAGLARLYSETDQLAEALEQVDLLRVNGFEHPLNWAWTSHMVNLSEAVSDLQDRSAAAVLYEQLRPVAGQVDTLVIMVASSGSYGLYCGLLAACLRRWDDADRHFADALAMNERLGARPFVARTRRAWAAMLLDRDAPGDREHSAELIAAGRAEAEQRGMARELARFERLDQRLRGAA